MEERTCDIIVLGGGPAGMTAAIYAKRANLDVVLLETNVTGGLVNSTYTVENFPSYPEIHGMELMEKMREHVDHMGVEVEEVFEVIGLELGEDEKAVHGDGIVYKAPAIILATGRKPIALDVPTECDQMHFCAICDGAPYKGKRVLVVGGGGFAVPKLVRALRPEASIDVVEIDPKVIEAARRWFFAGDASARVYCADGFDFIRGAALRGKKYDLIALDAFSGAEPVASLAGDEAARAYAQLLAPGGAVAGNVVTPGGDASFLRDFQCALEAAFARVELVPCRDDDWGADDNYLLVARA